MTTVDAEKLGGKDYIDDVDEEEFTREEQRSIIRRVDWRLISVLGAVYSIQLMDRGNVPMAAISGMLADLKIDSYGYSIIVLTFFVTYIVFQPPSTVLIRKMGPRNFLTSIVMCWGALMIGLGFAKTWGAVVAVRVLLGAFAAGYFPSCMYLLSCWYTRYEVQKRFSLFYCIGAVASSLTGILAYGLTQMNGMSGIAGWSWIFIMEGVITCAIGLFAFLLLVDFPDRAQGAWHFLNERELSFIIRRINKDRADADDEPFNLGKFLKPALDLKLWAYAVIFCCLTINTYAMAYFLAIILNGMGFSVGQSQCLSAPPWAFAGIVMVTTSWVADKYRTRAPVMVFNTCLSFIGLPLMGFAKGNAARLVGAFLTVAGANANVPSAMAWQANNVRGHWTRAFSSALLIIFDGIGGIISSLVFEKDAPQYRPGIFTAIGANVVLLIMVASLTLWFRYCNAQANRGQRIIEGSSEFRYTI